MATCESSNTESSTKSPTSYRLDAVAQLDRQTAVAIAAANTPTTTVPPRRDSRTHPIVMANATNGDDAGGTAESPQFPVLAN